MPIASRSTSIRDHDRFRRVRGLDGHGDRGAPEPPSADSVGRHLRTGYPADPDALEGVVQPSGDGHGPLARSEAQRHVEDHLVPRHRAERNPAMR